MPVAPHPVTVEEHVVEQDWDEALVGVKQMTEQSEAIVFALQDEEDAEELEDCEVIVLEGSELFWDLDLLLSSGLLGFSGLLGLLGSLGLVSEPAPLISPPPDGPGGQKGQIQEGPCNPQPPVPPFHLFSIVSLGLMNVSQEGFPGKCCLPDTTWPNNDDRCRDCKLATVLIGLRNQCCYCRWCCDSA